jgi:DNA-binding FadR family transcriptional regulator
MTQDQNDGEAERVNPLSTFNDRAKPARAHKASMVIAQKIVHAISLHNYRPGTKLPTEREMLEEYGVSRGTLRESLRLLEMNGVITMKPGPGGGPFTGYSDARDLAGTLALFLEMHRTSFRSIVEVRMHLEPIIARLAARNATAELLHEILESVELMRSNLDNEALFLEANEGFHLAVAQASALGVDYSEERREAVLAAHERVYQAIAAGDADAAESAMSHHIREFNRYLDRYYSAIYDSEVFWSDIAR